jgi:hypothetical protein
MSRKWPTMPANLDAVRYVLDNRAARVLLWESAGADHAGILLDVQTANMLITVHAAMSDDQKAKVETMIAESPARFVRVVDACWKAVR